MAEHGKSRDDNDGDDTSKSFSSAISGHVFSDVEEEIPSIGEEEGLEDIAVGGVSESVISTDGNSLGQPSKTTSKNLWSDRWVSENFFNHGDLVPVVGEAFVCKAVEGDGSCFFHAVIDQLDVTRSGHGWNHISLRQAAVTEMRQHPENYIEFFGVTSIKKYNKKLDELEKLETFVDHPIIQATAVVLGYQIVIIKFEYGHRYGSVSEPSKTDNTTGIMFLGLENEHYWSLRHCDRKDMTSWESSGKNASNSNNNNSKLLRYQDIKKSGKFLAANNPNSIIRTLNLGRKWKIIDDEPTESSDGDLQQDLRRDGERRLGKSKVDVNSCSFEKERKAYLDAPNYSEQKLMTFLSTYQDIIGWICSIFWVMAAIIISAVITGMLD